MAKRNAEKHTEIDTFGTRQLLTSSHLRERDKMLLGTVKCVEVRGMVSCLVRLREKPFVASSVVRQNTTGTVSGKAPSPPPSPLVSLRDKPAFASLVTWHG